MKVAGRPLRYLLAGAFNTLLAYAAWVLALLAGLAVPWAGLVSLAVGMAAGFFVHGRFVFGHLSAAALARFVAYWATMYFVHLGLVLALREAGLHPVPGGAVATCVMVLLSYFVLGRWVYRPSEPKPPETRHQA